MAVEKKTREELIELIHDPDVDLSSLEDYLTLQFDPETGVKVDAVEGNLKVAEDVDNPLTEANIAFDWVVKAIRERRKDIFMSRLEKNSNNPIVVLDGDSWAQHPLVKEIFEHLSNSYNVYCSSLAGRTMQELHDENRYIEMLQDIQQLGHFDKVQAVVLSGGGNDLFGLRVSEIIKDFDADRPDDPDAHINASLFNELTDEVIDLYKRVIHKIRASFRDARFPIVMHSYSYLTPWDVNSGLLPRDKWIGDPMREKGISNPDLQRSIVIRMVDQFHAKLEAIVPDSDILLDNRRLIPAQRDLWSDEIHPSSAGFKLVGDSIKAAITPP